MGGMRGWGVGMCTGYIHDAGVRMGGFFHVRSDVCNPEVGCTNRGRSHGDALDASRDANDRRARVRVCTSRSGFGTAGGVARAIAV